MLKLYYANTDLIANEDVFHNLLNKMNKQRSRKVLRCKNEEDKLCSLLAGVLLRYALEEQGLVYEKLEFSVTQEGKPTLDSHPEMFFSLSHSGKRAVCLLSDKPIGVDVENKQRRLLEEGREACLMRVVGRSFNVQEHREYMSASEEERRELFLKYWTRKEAVSKAEGKGLALDFSKIEEPEEKFISFWLDEDYYVSIYQEEKLEPGEELIMEEVSRVQFG